MRDVAIIVCGGREFADRGAVYRALAKATTGASRVLIIHGAARGADSLAHDWATAKRAAAERVSVEEWHADWIRLGRAAGHARNRDMLVRLLACPHKRKGVIAFPGGSGTAGMVRIARAADVPVWEPLNRA